MVITIDSGLLPMALRKGLHNEELCNLLAEQNRWHDWVVVTAFYSALHLVDATLFPFDEDEVTRHHSIDDYSVRHGGARGKHGIRMSLVARRLRPIYDSFRFLHERASEMRYGDDFGDASLAESALRHLQHLKSFCM